MTNRRILTVGDSIAAYVSTRMTLNLAHRSPAYAHTVVSRPGYALAGSNDFNFNSWLPLLGQLMSEVDPIRINVILGTNDAARNINNPTFQTAIAAFVNACGGRPIVWANVCDRPWNTFWLPNGALHQNWAIENTQYAIANFKRADVKSAMNNQNYFTFDGLHPNATGADIYANTICNLIPT